MSVHYNNLKVPAPFRFVHYWLLGFAVIFYIVLLMKNGLQVGPDSTVYVRGALNLANGKGYTMGRYFINHFPIGLSLIYAVVIKLFPISIFNAALILNIIWIGLSGLLFNALLKSSGLHWGLQLLGLALFLFSEPFLTMSSRIMTELPTTTILLACTLLFVKQRNSPRFRYAVFLIGCLLGVGLLIRFAMLGFLAAFALLMLWQSGRNWKSGLLNAVVVIAPSILLMLCYSMYVSRVYKISPVNRVLLWHPITLDKLISFFKIPLSWIFNVYHWNTPINGFIIIGLGWMFIHYALSLTGNNKRINFFFHSVLRNVWFHSIIIITCTYCFFLIVSISLFDADTSIDIRILSPISFLFYWGIALLFNHVYRVSSNSQYNLIGLCILGGLFSHTFPLKAYDIYTNPDEYSTPYWKNDAPLIIDDTTGTWLKPKRTIYTNAVAFWQMHNNKRVYQLPIEQHKMENQTNRDFENELHRLIDKLTHDSAQVVYFYNMPSDTKQDNTVYIRRNFTDSTGLLFVPMKDGIIIRAKINREDSPTSPTSSSTPSSHPLSAPLQ